MKTITMKRNDEEQAADEKSAKGAQITVHAWRRAVLNAANGLSRLPTHLQRLTREKMKGRSRD